MLEQVKDYIKGIKPDGFVPKLKANSVYWSEIESYCLGEEPKNNSEKIYLYLNQIKIPKCDCGKNRVFISVIKGYREFCGNRCSYCIAQQVKNRVNTQNANGGVGLARASCRTVYEATMLEEYQCTNYFGSNDHKELLKSEKNGMKQQSIIDGIRSKCEKEHGVNWHSKRPEVKEKKDQTCIKKYNNTNPMKNVEIAEKASSAKKNAFYENLNNRNDNIVIPLFSQNEYKGVVDRTIKYKWKCSKCENEFYDYLDDGHIPRCQQCYPFYSNSSKAENEIADYLESITAISPKRGISTIIPPYHIDIFFPTLNIGVEYHGLYFHSENGPNKRDKKYHLRKNQLCKEKGIRLIQIFENEWRDKKEIVKLRLNHIFQNSNKIFARKLKIEQIDAKVAREFLERTHIQGFSGAIVHYALLLGDDIKAVMSFSALRRALGSKSKEGFYELVRYASTDAIVGGGSRLLSRFIKDYNPEHIISYSDNRWNTGKFYENIGFTYVKETEPNYWYIDQHMNLHYRFSFRKSEIKTEENKDLSEWEIMQSKGYYRIWDCGSSKYIWEK